MPVVLTINETAQIMNRQFPSTAEITADGVSMKEINVPAAKAGSLTTRDSDTAGELTMQAGHEIETGDRLDIYWDGGSRRGVTVGTVATNAVPFSLGDGDNLPDNLSAVTAMVPIEEEMLVTGNDVEAIAFFSSRLGTIVLAESDDGESFFKVLGGGAGTIRSFVWVPDRDATNPVAGDDIAKVFFSHSDSANEALMRAALLFD